MNAYIKYLFSLPKTIAFNFRYLPFFQAVYLPFYVRYGTKINIKGRILIKSSEKLYPAMIVIGSHETPISDPKHTTRITVKHGGILLFERTAHIGLGTKIFVAENAKLCVGDNFAVSANSQFLCYNKITLGRDIQFSWDCLVMDSDTHTIFDAKSKRINTDKEIKIADKVWVGCRVTILKGTIIPKNCVIGATSLVLGDEFKENTIILGCPAKSVRKIGGWEL